MNGNLKNDDHTLSQCKESSYFNEIDGDVENGDVSGGNCFMNGHTISDANNLSSIYSTKKREENIPNIS